MIDILLLAIVAVITWLVASDGPWGGAITFVTVLIAGLVAMNLFEPLAGFLSTNILRSFEWSHRWDIIALLGLFIGGVFGLRALGEYLLPTYAVVNSLLYELARWGLGLLTGYVVMAIVLTSLHVAPLPREFLGFTPERNNFFGMAPDRQWLAFTQYVSEHALSHRRAVIFDGARAPAKPPLVKVQGEEDNYEVWSSFVIRYAARRQLYAPEKNAAGGADRPPSQQRVSPGGGSPGGGSPGGASPGGGTGGF